MMPENIRKLYLQSELGGRRQTIDNRNDGRKWDIRIRSLMRLCNGD